MVLRDDISFFPMPERMPPSTRLAQSKIGIPSFPAEGLRQAPPGLEESIPLKHALKQMQSVSPRFDLDQSLLSSVEKGFSASCDSADGCSTLMVKHVPPWYTQKDMLEMVNSAGFVGQVDFLYLPGHVKGGNRGFAFINFSSVETAQDFLHRFDGSYDLIGDDRVNRPLAVMAANLQGLKANVENLIHHRIWHAWQEPPLIFNASYRASFKACMQTAGGDVDKRAKVSKQPSKPSKGKHMDFRQETNAPVTSFSALCREMNAPGMNVSAFCREVNASGVNVTAFRKLSLAEKQDAARAARARVRMFCEFCGSRRPPTTPFCPFCGEFYTNGQRSYDAYP
jgi:hypothetical protein